MQFTEASLCLEMVWECVQRYMHEHLGEGAVDACIGTRTCHSRTDIAHTLRLRTPATDPNRTLPLLNNTYRNT